MPHSSRHYWIGIDGEGIGRNPHRYVMMARSDARGRTDVIERSSGLRTVECLDWLLSAPTDARLCGYYLGYDWTMILRELPDKLIYRLLRPELRVLPKDEGSGFSQIHWKGYKLHYLAGMMRIKRGQKSVTVWDIGKFFQSPFVDAIRAWGINDDETNDAILLMKNKRSEFTDGDSDAVRDYCLLECQSLAKLAASLEQAHDDIGLHLANWHGPGSTASALLTQMNIHELRGEAPKEVHIAADYAFFGGRFEHSCIGDVYDCIGWDLVNAYVFEAYNLPCLIHGVWKRITNEKDLRRVAHACVNYQLHDIGSAESWGPLPCRMPNGTITYPRAGTEGWIWLREWLAAKAHWAGLTFKQAWGLYTECECRPFARLLELYHERIRLGKTGKGKVTKNAMNSGYGKLAQTVGQPKFASRIWAGMITSGTRARMLDLISLHKKRSNVRAIATDGLYTTDEFDPPKPPLKDIMFGAWESKGCGTMTFVRPGIYWSHNGIVRARGISRRQFTTQRESVREAIDAEDERASIGESTLFGGARACVYRLRDGSFRRSRFYGEWHNIPAYVSLSPEPKRRRDWSLHVLSGVKSAPYARTALSDDARLMQLIGDVFWGTK